MKDKNTKSVLLAFFIFISILIVYNAGFTTSYSFGPNYENVSVDTQVNITNAAPEVLAVLIDEQYDGPPNITLSAGQTRTVYCNSTIRDWNGFADVNRSNATLWDNNDANMGDSNNNTNHYTNTSCANVGDNGVYESYWTCTFNVQYYANNGSDWRCNVTGSDQNNFTGSGYNTTTFNPLYALNVSNTSLDYGDIAVGDYSSNQTVNVTNFGNMDINISTWGYGVTFNDGLAFNCSINSNISIDLERFTINSSNTFSEKTNLSNSAQDIGLTITRQTVAGQTKSNSTYWQVYIDPTNNPAGFCTGTVVFEAAIP